MQQVNMKVANTQLSPLTTFYTLALLYYHKIRWTFLCVFGRRWTGKEQSLFPSSLKISLPNYEILTQYAKQKLLYR